METMTDFSQTTTIAQTVNFPTEQPYSFKTIAGMENRMGRFNVSWKMPDSTATELDEFLMDWIDGALNNEETLRTYSNLVAKKDLDSLDLVPGVVPIPVFGSWSRLSVIPNSATKRLSPLPRTTSSFAVDTDFLDEWVRRTTGESLMETIVPLREANAA